MNGGDLIGETLRKQGVKYLFTLCGGHISPILVGAKKQNIKVIDVRHEPTAVFAADAIARLTGIPGVATVTAGPGVTNSITALKNAQMAQSPLILFGGAAATILQGKGALQDIEQLDLLKSVVKWAVAIEQNCDIVPIVEEAFKVAMSGIPGPVFIECPIDILYDEELVREWYGKKSGSKTSSSIKQKVVNWYLNRHVDKLFACAPNEIKIKGNDNIIPFSIEQGKIEQVISEINNAQKPILILGKQVTLRKEIIDQLSSGLKNLGIPIFLASMSRGLLGGDHPNYFRHGRSNALKEADIIIIAGMPVDFRLGYGRKINKKAYHIAINRSEEELEKNKKPDLKIQSDPGTFLLELTQASSFESNKWKAWFDTLKKWEDQGISEIKKFGGIKTEFINPLLFLEEINKHKDQNSIIIGDGGDFVATASYIVKPTRPLSWLDPGPYGTLGVGAGFALAAKLTHPDSEVWLIYGDGAAGYSIAELDTFIRHELPIIAVIGNDAGWTQIERDQVKYLKDPVGTTLKFTDYHQVARGYGAEGLFLDQDENIGETLIKAKEYARNGKPVLINAKIGKTKFREGSISM
ncbi:MAG: Acetolactate synthase [Promethearchaeota archaeon]|nr:MAG: Acetolactate synthase [Candidatus Lokiarchaeota archaeon]